MGVLAAGGKTGRAVATALRKRGVAVRAIHRDQMANLAVALRGCEATYLIAPNMHEDEPALVEHALAASAAAGVPHVVYHSVAAPFAPGMAHHVAKATAEDLVRRGPCTWTILQPCVYTQNFIPALLSLPPVITVAYDPEQTFAFVDLDDVADAAAVVLLDPRHHGATYELGGPALMSMQQLAAAASQILATEVRVARVGADEWAARFGGDLQPRVRQWLLAMFAYYNANGLPAGSLALHGLRGRPPTTLDRVLRRELG